jgi:hypothetical protein
MPILRQEINITYGIAPIVAGRSSAMDVHLRVPKTVSKCGEKKYGNKS